MLKRTRGGSCKKVSVSVEEREGVDKFNYIGMLISMDRGICSVGSGSEFLREER